MLGRGQGRMMLSARRLDLGMESGTHLGAARSFSRSTIHISIGGWGRSRIARVVMIRHWKQGSRSTSEIEYMLGSETRLTYTKHARAPRDTSRAPAAAVAAAARRCIRSQGD